MTIEQFLAVPDSIGFELIEGVLTTRRERGALASHIAARIATALADLCLRGNRGYVFGAGATYACFEHRNTGRRAGVSFIRRGRLPNEQIPVGCIGIPADLIVEVVSPRDTAYEVEEKVALYLGNGFGEVWVVFPNTRTVHVRRRGEPFHVLDDR